MLLSSVVRAVLRLAGFVLTTVFCYVAAGSASALLAGLFGLTSGSEGLGWLFPASFTVLLTASTWLFLRIDRRKLDALGLRPTRRRLAELGVGFAAGALVFAGVAVLRASWVGAAFTFDPGAGLRAALIGLPLVFLRMFPEELVFRGYGFQQLQRLLGDATALWLSALAFGAYHVVGSGLWGMGAGFVFLSTACGGLLFGVALLRTGGLALPTGLHFGANWINLSVVGLGFPEGSAPWVVPLTDVQVEALTAPDLLPHLPYFAAVALLFFAVRAWTGSSRLLISHAK